MADQRPVGQAAPTDGPRVTGPVVRHLRPTDLVALAAFEARDFPNEARIRDRLDRDRRRPLAIATVLEQWIAAEDRQTLVAVSGLAIRGLVSARHRLGRGAWEVDWLVMDYDRSDDWGAQALLDRLSDEAAKAQVSRVFLRLRKGSGLITAALRAGFVSYCLEMLLRRECLEAVSMAGSPGGIELRPRGKFDDLGIFRLYHGAVPPQVRSMEGMTLEEWCATREVHFGHQREYVWCQDDRIRAWLQLNRGNGTSQFRLLLHPEDESRLAELVALGLGQLSGHEPILALVPHFQPGLQRLLKDIWQFQEVTEYENLARQLAVRVPEARLMPVRA